MLPQDHWKHTWRKAFHYVLRETWLFLVCYYVCVWFISWFLFGVHFLNNHRSIEAIKTPHKIHLTLKKRQVHLSKNRESMFFIILSKIQGQYWVSEFICFCSCFLFCFSFFVLFLFFNPINLNLVFNTTFWRTSSFRSILRSLNVTNS